MAGERGAGAGRKRARADALPDPLAAYGEAFMRMFDDYDETKQPTSSPDGSSDSDEDCTGSGSGAADSSGDGEEDSDADQGVAGPGPGSLQQYLHGGRRKGLGPAGPGTAQGGPRAPHLAPHMPAGGSGLTSTLEKRMRKKFMSAKASDIFADDAPGALGGTSGPSGDWEDADLGGMTPQEFAAVQREVELLGASGLDKKARKAWKADMLARIGAAADKAPRTPAHIGLGMAKKAREREAKALEEAIETGMAKRKGMGKKRRAEQAGDRDLGLRELDGGFKNGVLRVGKPKAAAGGRGGGAQRGSGSTSIPSSFGGSMKPAGGGKGKGGGKGRGAKNKGAKNKGGKGKRR